MQQFLGDPESGCLDFESNNLALAIAKKALDENRFKHPQQTTDCIWASYKIGDRVYFKNKQLEKWDLKWRVHYRIICIEHSGHYFYIENQATGKTRPCNVKDVVHELPVEQWNVYAKFSRDWKFINHPETLPTILLNTNQNNTTYSVPCQYPKCHIHSYLLQLLKTSGSFPQTPRY